MSPPPLLAPPAPLSPPPLDRVRLRLRPGLLRILPGLGLMLVRQRPGLRPFLPLTSESRAASESLVPPPGRFISANSASFLESSSRHRLRAVSSWRHRMIILSTCLCAARGARARGERGERKDILNKKRTEAQGRHSPPFFLATHSRRVMHVRRYSLD